MSAATEAATDPGASAWVSANAGAGKTYLLTDRVTRLLLAGANPSRILCLTYTKAAAAEMATRLFDRLGEWALQSDDELTAHLTENRRRIAGWERLRGSTPPVRAGAGNAGRVENPDHPFLLPARAGALSGGGGNSGAFHRARRTQRRRTDGGGAGRGPGARSRGRCAASKARVAVLAKRAWPTEGLGTLLDFAVGDAEKLRDVLAHHGDEAQLFAHLRRTLGIGEGEDETQIVARFCAELGSERANIRAHREMACRWIGARYRTWRDCRNSWNPD